MKTNQFFSFALVSLLLVSAAGCFPEYFPNTGAGTWRGAAYGDFNGHRQRA